MTVATAAPPIVGDVMVEIFIDPPSPYQELVEGHLLQMAAGGKQTGIIKLNRNGLVPTICLAANLQLWVVDWPKGRLDRKTPECVEQIAALWQRTTAVIRAGEFAELVLEGVGQSLRWGAISLADIEALQNQCNLHGLEAIANV